MEGQRGRVDGRIPGRRRERIVGQAAGENSRAGGGSE
jgi:hypothetical protein